MSSAYSSSIHTQGGAVFSGNLSANRDININHITEIKPLVHALHYSFFTSSDLFRQVQNELALLLVALDTAKENLESASVKNSLLSELDKELQNCHWVLLELKDVKDHLESVGSQTQLTWEREGWKLDKLADIRARLSSYVYVMDLDVDQFFARFSQSHIQKMLEVFIDEVRTGKREESVISGDSLSMNGKEAWRQLRKELQSVGISHEAFSQNRDFIMAALKKAIMDEELVGDITLKIQDMDDSRQEEEIQGQFQNSVDQISQNRNPKSALPAWVKRPPWMPTFIYKAIDRENDFTTEDLNLGNQSQREEMDDKGGKALGEAAGKGHESVVQSLIERGADVNWVDRDDDNDLTALHKAAENGHNGVVRVLLANGADVRPLDFWGDTALHKAAGNEHVKIVKLLLKNGAKKDWKSLAVAKGQAPSAM